MSYLINYLKNYLFIRSYKKKNKKSDAEHHHDDANDTQIEPGINLENILSSWFS
jgi:hypothetical protein